MHGILAPTVTAPASVSLNENGSFVFSGTAALAIADVDANGGKELVTLTATNGSIDLGSVNGVTITAGANGTSSLTMYGTVAQLNSALTGLVLFPV